MLAIDLSFMEMHFNKHSFFRWENWVEVLLFFSLNALNLKQTMCWFFGLFVVIAAAFFVWIYLKFCDLFCHKRMNRACWLDVSIFKLLAFFIFICLFLVPLVENKLWNNIYFCFREFTVEIIIISNMS